MSGQNDPLLTDVEKLGIKLKNSKPQYNRRCGRQEEGKWGVGPGTCGIGGRGTKNSRVVDKANAARENGGQTYGLPQP